MDRKFFGIGLSLVLLVIFTAQPNLITGTALVCGLALLIAYLTYEPHWTIIDFALIGLCIVGLLHVLLTISTTPSINTLLLSIVIGVAFFVCLLIAIFLQQDPKPLLPVKIVPLSQKKEEDLVVVQTKGSKTVHRPICLTLQRSKKQGQTKFASWNEAKRKGLRPCKACKPDQKE